MQQRIIEPGSSDSIICGDTESKGSELIALANTAAWLDLLYSKCTPDDGVLVIVAAQRNRLAGVHTVGSGGDLVAAAKEMQANHGCYLKINLMDWEAMEQRRRAQRKLSVVGGVEEVKTIVSFHLDVDASKSGKYVRRAHALWALDRMPIQPTLIINSNGESGGFHCYWCLEKPYRIQGREDRKKIQLTANRWNERLRELCAGRLDSTSNIDRVLRVVGVPRKDGGSVCLHSYHPQRTYRMEDF